MLLTRSEYVQIHTWLRRTYGDASMCENSGCDGPTGRFEWALIAGKKHEKNRENYRQLCVGCHRKYDHKHKNFGAITGAEPRRYLDLGYINIRMSKKAHRALLKLALENRRTLHAQLDIILGV